MCLLLSAEGSDVAAPEHECPVDLLDRLEQAAGDHAEDGGLMPAEEAGYLTGSDQVVAVGHAAHLSIVH